MKKLSVVVMLMLATLTVATSSLASRSASFPRQTAQVEDGTIKSVQGIAKMDGDKIKFVADEDGHEWNLINPELLQKLIGRHIEITGHLYPSKGSIHIHTIKKLKS